MPKPRPVAIQRDRQGAAARRAKRSRAAIRRAPAQRFRRQFRPRKARRESAAWRLFLCGIQPSPLHQMADWAVEWLACGEHSLRKPPCFPYCTPLRRHQAAKRCFTESAGASTRLPDRCAGATCLRQTSPFDIAVTRHLTNLVDAANVNLRKHRSAGQRSAVPNLGVTCPHFFRCEAPRSYNSPYSRASASHRRRTCGACHARRNSFLMDCQSSPRKLNVIPLSPARKFTPISSFSSATVYARK